MYKYIIEVIVGSGLLLVAYRWMLARKVSFGLCRTFIMTSMLLAVVIPAMNVPVFPEKTTREQTIMTWLDFIEEEPEVTAVAESAAKTEVSVETSVGMTATKKGLDIKAAAGIAVEIIYILVALASLGLTAYNAIKIQRLRRRSELTYTEEYTLAEHEDVKTPFSFLMTIFMGFNYEPDERSQILAHEASHVRHRHSFERMTFSILRSLFWFNPFFWMAEKDLEEVQEWEADKDVLNEGYELNTYRTTIFKQLFGYNPDISCGLNHSLTKQRFIMMTQSRSGKRAWIRLAATLPVIAAVFLAFGCGTRQAKASDKVSTDLTNGTEATYLPMCPPCDATVSNSFGAKTDSPDAATHQGIDYVLNEGDPIYAAAEGEVSSITRDDCNGLMLVLKHTDGIETRYAHLSKIQIVSHLRIEGSMMKVNNTYNLITDADHSDQKITGKVNRGQLIGYAGSTGRATGPHLHFEVRKDGKPVDPVPMFTSDKPVTAPFPIYVVEGTNKPGEEYFAICNGKLCKMNEEIGEAVSRYLAGIDDPQYATIQLEADKDVPEEIVAKVSEELRKVQSLKVSKTVSDGNPGEVVVLKDATTTVSRIANGALIDVIYDPDGSRIYIDGARHSLDEVADVIGRKRNSSEKPYEFTVHIKADGDIRMGIIDDIKLELRKCKALKVRYETPDKAIDKRLPPAPSPDESENDLEAKFIAPEDWADEASRRNLITFRINSADKVLMSTDRSFRSKEYYICDIDDFDVKRLKEMLANPERKTMFPETELRDIAMPDGSVRQFEVSKGIVSYGIDRGTSYDAYTKGMEMIMAAYKELRENFSGEVFGKPLAELTDAEMQTVYLAVPANISEANPRDVPQKD